MQETDLPHVTVATVVHRQDQFLLVREFSNGAMVYNQPAGHVEPGESLLDAAVRETLEETAWQVELESLLGIYHYSAPNGISYVRHCFTARPLKEIPNQALDQDIDAALWLDETSVFSLRDQWRSPMVWSAIEDFRRGETHSLSLFKS
ncbi:MAG: NUDIX hydrolase [Gammaproteobacteria bacterium]|nr:NUDIX hydrolase [Gammaproteobacteria bacterium]MCY4357243.1 NUDIX hydrolase [Gammaproteobacteria bacterium]